MIDSINHRQLPLVTVHGGCEKKMAAARQSSKKKEKLPFYQATRDQTSSSIIAEARKDLKSVSTKRPDTPGDATRRLFGSHQHSAQQGAVKRPPSVYRSVGATHCWNGLLLLCRVTCANASIIKYIRPIPSS